MVTHVDPSPNFVFARGQLVLEEFGSEKRRWWRGSGEEEIGDLCKDGGGDKAVGKWVCEDGYGGKGCRRCIYGYLGSMHRLDWVIGIGKFEENNGIVISKGYKSKMTFPVNSVSSICYSCC